MTRSRRARSARGAGAGLREEILAATRKLLAEKANADAVSMRAIAQEVGVSPPSIYRHFEDKDVLIEAVVLEVLAELEVVLGAAVSPEDSPLEQMRQFGLAYVRFAREHPEQYRIAPSGSGTSIGKVDLVLSSSVFVRFDEIIRACMAAGVIEPGDPMPVALQLWATAHGVASLLNAKPYLPWGDPEEFADRVLAMACIGRSVSGIIGEDATPEQVEAWLQEQQGPSVTT